MRPLARWSLLACTAAYGCVPVLTIGSEEEAIAIAKQQCAQLIPKDGSEVSWVAIASGGATWSSWEGYGEGWEVHGQYTPRTPRDILSVVDLIVFVPKHGRPRQCDAVST